MSGRWAVFESNEGGVQYRISGWMRREQAEDALTSLLEDGEADVFIAPEDGGDAERRSIEDDYRRHLRRERWPEEPHPDGGFFESARW